MAYCVQCGVELAAGAEKCPLCETPVVLPGKQAESHCERLYPKGRPGEEEVYEPSLFGLIIYTIILAIPFFLTLLLDLSLHGSMTWSFYPVSSIALFWVLTAGPLLIRKNRFSRTMTMITAAIALFLYLLNLHLGEVTWAWYPVSALALFWVYTGLPGFLPAGWRRTIYAICIAGVMTAAFLWFMEFYTQSGNWFLPLALPLVGLATAVMLTVAVLVLTGKIRDYAITSTCFVAAGLLSLGADLLVDRYLTQQISIGWSLITLVVTVLIAALFAVVHKRVELQVLLKKKFHF